MVSQAERRATTRGAIIAAARDRFGAQGFTATPISEILADADVSRGALYHHFETKEDVFAAVFLATSNDAIRTAVAGVPRGASPREALLAACTGWLEAIGDPVTGRILLDDGVAVLGWGRSRTLEGATSLGVMRSGLAAAVESGELDIPDVELAARLINAVLAEAALGLGPRPTKKKRERAVATVTAMIDGFARR